MGNVVTLAQRLRLLWRGEGRHGGERGGGVQVCGRVQSEPVTLVGKTLVPADHGAGFPGTAWTHRQVVIGTERGEQKRSVTGGGDVAQQVDRLLNQENHIRAGGAECTQKRQRNRRQQTEQS